MATRINFGKYKGWTMEDLAQAGPEGRSYLIWCASNLRNPQLQRAAENALRANTSINPALMSRLEYQLGDLTPDEIEREIKNAQYEADEETRRNTLIESIEAQLRADLQALGVSEQVVRFTLANLHVPEVVFERIQFRSPEKERLFKAATDKYDAALSAAF